MTNTLTIWIAVIVAGLLAADAVLFDWSNSLFLGRKFADLLWWLAFWR